MVRPPSKDAATARTEAFALFDSLFTERYVAISWGGGDYDGIEWIPRELVRSRAEALRRDSNVGFVQIRSWSGKYDADAAS